MRQLLMNCALFVALIPACSASAQDAIYEGSWKTTNRKLDGLMTCSVTETSSQRWQGRFYGVWQGVPFDYTVEFVGPPQSLEGTATIDGASYDWAGQIDHRARRFVGTFGGNRYQGYFNLKEKWRRAALE